VFSCEGEKLLFRGKPAVGSERCLRLAKKPKQRLGDWEPSGRIAVCVLWGKRGEKKRKKEGGGIRRQWQGKRASWRLGKSKEYAVGVLRQRENFGAKKLDQRGL